MSGLREIMPGRQGWDETLPDLRIGFENLLLHKLRSLLTMLGIVFGVAAVIAMMSIGAGARQQVLAFIEQMGIRNIIVEAKEAVDWQELRKTRKTSPGLSFQDCRIIRANIAAVVDATPRKRFEPSKVVPKPQRDVPVIYGVEPNYRSIANLHIIEGRFFDAKDNASAEAVAVLGYAIRGSLFNGQDAIGQYVKVNEQWFRVIGVLGPQITADGALQGLTPQDTNNIIYIPLAAAIFRLEDVRGGLKDEIDGIYLQLRSAGQSMETAEVLRGILSAMHGNTPDFSIVVPAQLLAEQRRTQRIFDWVMFAIASISLLIGGIGIMNIMLANILERTREIGIRRAMGARRKDVIRQFLIEAVLISLSGGLIGILVGFGISKLIAVFAGWSTIMTLSSIMVAFLFSVSVGLVFGMYPAIQASRLDPVEAIRYE